VSVAKRNSASTRWSRHRACLVSTSGDSRPDRAVARRERAPLFAPELEAVGVKRKRRRRRKQHHKLTVGDRLLARSARRPSPGLPRTGSEILHRDIGRAVLADVPYASVETVYSLEIIVAMERLGGRATSPSSCARRKGPRDPVRRPSRP